MLKLTTAAIQTFAVIWCTLVVHACVMQLRLVFMTWIPMQNRTDAVFPGLLLQAIRPSAAIQYAWPQGLTVMVAFCAYGVASVFWVKKGPLRAVPATLLAVTLVLLARWIQWAQPDKPGLAAYEWLMRVVCLAAMTLVAIRINILFRDRVQPWVADFRTPARSKGAPKRQGRYNLGFSLVELLIVITIIMVLAAISFAVIGSSKNSARTTREISQLRQVYVALNLYEVDYDHESPVSLARLVPAYMPADMLRCPTDARNSLALSTWPANPWVNIQPPDPAEYVNARSPFINSYFYLKPFEGRFATGRTYNEYRNDPEVGLLSGVGLMQCGTSAGKGSSSDCQYSSRGGPGQPASNLSGTIVTVRTDGSIKVRRRPDNCGPATLGQFQLFFFAPLACGPTAVTGG
jgi:type II secretory pathway pseudopilin PulG